jgi:hypothetical protein
MNIKIVKPDDLTEFGKTVRNEDLELKEIGLLSVLLTKQLISKDELYKVFGKTKVDSAWKGLREKGYIIFALVQDNDYSICYVNCKPFTSEEARKIIEEIKANYKIEKIDISNNLLQ